MRKKHKRIYIYFQYTLKRDKVVTQRLTCKMKSHIITDTSQKNRHKVGETLHNGTWERMQFTALKRIYEAIRFGKEYEEYVCLHGIHSFNR